MKHFRKWYNSQWNYQILSEFRIKSNSNLFEITALELFRIFSIIFVFFVKISVRLDQLNIITHLHHLNSSYSIHFQVRFDRVKPEVFKKFEKVRVWYELELNWIYFYRVRLGKRLTFHSFTVFCFSSLFKFYLILIFHN